MRWHEGHRPVSAALLCALMIGGALAKGSDEPAAFSLPAATETSTRSADAMSHREHVRLLNADRYSLVTEIERQRSADRMETSNALTIYPGLRWQSGFIHQLELRLGVEREHERGNSPASHSTGEDVGVRVRRNLETGHPKLGAFVRALVGQKRSSATRREFAYVEPALTWAVANVELYSGYRMTRTLNDRREDNRDQLRVGIGKALNEQFELEWRASRAWASGSRVNLSDAVEVELTWIF